MAMVFAGNVIKGIDEMRCPKEYNAEKGEGNSYTVYVLVESFKMEDGFDVPTNADAELRQLWGESFKDHVGRAIENNPNLPFSGVEYSESEDGGVLAVHGTTLKKIHKDQLEAKTNGWASCLEKLILYPNNAVKSEINRRRLFKGNAEEIRFLMPRQMGII